MGFIPMGCYDRSPQTFDIVWAWSEKSSTAVDELIDRYIIAFSSPSYPRRFWRMPKWWWLWALLWKFGWRFTKWSFLVSDQWRVMEVINQNYCGFGIYMYLCSQPILSSQGFDVHPTPSCQARLPVLQMRWRVPEPMSRRAATMAAQHGKCVH